jgi:hypothetical protein
MPIEHYRHEHGLDTEAIAKAAAEAAGESARKPEDGPPAK